MGVGARLVLLLLLVFVSSCDGRRWGRRSRYSSGGGGGGWPTGGLDDLGIGLICMVVAVAVFVLCFNCFYYGCCDALFGSDNEPTPKSTRSGQRAAKKRKTLCYLCQSEINNFLWDNGTHRRMCGNTTSGKTKLEAMPQPFNVFCQCGDKLRLWPEMEGTWNCDTCPSSSEVFPKTNDGNNRLNCFLCDYDICAECAGNEERPRGPEKATWRKFFEERADTDLDGFLSVEELHAVFPEHDKAWAQGLVDRIDSDHDGRVSLEEFRAYYHDELDNEAMRKNTVINTRKRLLRREDSVDGWTKKTEWSETGGQWQQTSYWTNKYTGERTDEDPFKHNLPLEMKNKAALKRMESRDGGRSIERESPPSTSYALTNASQPSASYALPYSPQPSASSALPYAPQPSAPSSLPYAAQPSASYGPPSLPPPSYTWATSTPVGSAPPTAPPLPSLPPPQAPPTGWIDPPPITMYNFGK